MFTVTRSAAKQIQRLVDRAGAKRPIVWITRQGPEADNKRGPRGESLWTKTEKGEWDVLVVEYDDYMLSPPEGMDLGPITAYGFEFSPLVIDYPDQLSKPFVDYKNKRFVVREST
jgi:hypothetical protein